MFNLRSSKIRWSFYFAIPIVTAITLTVLLWISYGKVNDAGKGAEFIVELVSASAAWIAAFLAYCGLIGATESMLSNTDLLRNQETIKVSNELNADMRLQGIKQELFFQGADTFDYWYSWFSVAEERQNDQETVLTIGRKKSDFLYVLNRYEFIALAIKKNVLDESLMKLMQKENIIKVWNYSRLTIKSIREQEQKDTLFYEFEWLAIRWGGLSIDSENN